MWWAGSRAVDLYLGTRAIAACRGDASLFAHFVGGPDQARTVLDASLRELPRRTSLRVWLSGGLCRPFLLQPVAGIRGAAEWQRVAEALGPTQTGLSQACDLWVETRPRSDGRIAAAVPRDVLLGLQQSVEQADRRLRISSIAPWWAEVLRAALKREPQVSAVAVHDCDSLVLLSGQGDAFDSATALTPVLNADTAGAALARQLLSRDVMQGQEILVRLLPSGAKNAHGSMALSGMAEWSR